jgi:stearoyl-CoA desaturase (delta-9 desaturase)
MMQPVHRVNGTVADPVAGHVEYDFVKMAWNLGMISGALVLAPLTFSASAFVLFLTSTYFSLLVGHSTGMHRMMIHRSYECHPVVERTLIYMGVLVGMSGPHGIIRIHDTRDWAQRQSACHSFFSHTQPYWKDVWWQLTSQFVFDRAPEVIVESKYADSRFYQWLESTWRWHQLFVAAMLYLWGGWPFVVWGVLVRVSVGIVGHWSITYFCHNPGQAHWRVANAAVQASNLPGLGIVTYGECWHNNHHAFPESARIGLEEGQCDPAYRFIQVLGHAGLARNIGSPRPEDQRDDLCRVTRATSYERR